jgi:hypothetical protein
MHFGVTIRRLASPATHPPSTFAYLLPTTADSSILPHQDKSHLFAATSCSRAKAHTVLSITPLTLHYSLASATPPLPSPPLPPPQTVPSPCTSQLFARWRVVASRVNK